MIRIDSRSPTPLYEQIVHRVEEMILLGLMNRDDQLPSVRSLAGDLAINPNTIQKAYGLLEQNGIIYSRQGRGSFVALSGDDLRQRRLPALRQDFLSTVEKLKDLRVPADDLVGDIWRIYQLKEKEEVAHDSH